MNYCYKNEIEIHEIYKSRENEVLLPATWKTNQKQEIIEIVTPPIYRADIINAIVFGSNDNIICGDYCLNDKIELPYSSKYNFANGACVLFDQTEKIAEVYINSHPEEIKCGINMFGVASLNYYHWMIDILSRIEYINHFPELMDVPLLVDEDALVRKTYREALEMFDTLHHPIISVERNKGYMVEKLFYFSPCTFSGVYPIRGGLRERSFDALSYSRNKESIEHFRKCAKSLMDNHEYTTNTKLFIDRGKSPSRLTNEREAMELAERYGFSRFNPGEYSLKEQISIISQAKIVIGDEGAAFTNSIWGNNCLFAIIEPSQWKDCLFSSIMHLSGNRCINLNAELLNSKNERDHIIDLPYFESFLCSEYCDV